MHASAPTSDREAPGVPQNDPDLRLVRATPRASNRLLLERWHPLVCAIATTLITSRFNRPQLLDLHEYGDFVVKVIDVSAVFAAYALTALTILPALNERGVVVRLRSAGLFRNLTSYLAAALWASLSLVLFGLFLKAAGYEVAKHYWLSRECSALWWGLTVFAALSLVRASRLLIALVSSGP